MPTEGATASPREIFHAQIGCIQRDDREAQLGLYAADCVYEFPFAVDRPRRLVGRDEIRRVMTPLWEDARTHGVRVVGCDAHVHATTDPELIVAEFTLSLEARGSVSRIPFVQVLHVRHGRIVHVREYFSPAARSELLDTHRQ